MMNIGVLTSSRADFGIYLPLLKRLEKCPDVHYELIVFGTHLSATHGHTIDYITQAGLTVKYRIVSMLQTDDPESIATAYALTNLKFAGFWSEHKSEFDIVFCLGDRYEMASAVNAGIPFGIRFAHLYGGETTLGAIDNVYRHQISLASEFNYVSLEDYANRVRDLVGKHVNCTVVGSLSLENLDGMELKDIDEFARMWGIDMNIPTILITIHPETVAYDKNHAYAAVIFDTISELVRSFQLVITMPNADTNGMLYRRVFNELYKQSPSRVFLIESFGTEGYFSCMKHCSMLLGNTSSGIIEAASFGKYVVNIGDRQKGRIAGDNVLNVSFNKDEIISMVKSLRNKRFDGVNIYWKEQPSKLILDDLLMKYKSTWGD